VTNSPFGTVSPVARPVTDDPPRVARHRRARSRITTPQRIALVATCALAAVAALFADAAPTGNRWIDAVQRAGIAILVVLAASRARRWALVVSSALVAIAALGPALLMGVVGLGIATYLVWADRRDRVHGAAVGALVATASFHLSVDAFLGAPTLVAVLACACLIGSGWRNSSRRVRWLGSIVLVVAGVWVIGSTAAVGAAGWRARTTLQEGVDATQRAVQMVQEGSTTASAEVFSQGSDRFSKAAEDLRAWWVMPARAVPILGQNLGVVQEVAASGAELTAAAARNAAEVDYDRIQTPEGGVDLTLLATFQDPVRATATVLRDADNVVADLDSPWIVAPLAERLDEFGEKVADLRQQADIAALAVDTAPGMLGANGPRRYLLLLGNPAEARELGGHIGQWAELTAIDGDLDLVEVGGPEDLALPAEPSPLTDPASFPPSLMNANPVRFPQNWGTTSDLPTVARLASELFRARTGRTIDGVLYADPVAFAQLLAITGPVPVPGLPLSVDADTAPGFLHTTQYVLFPSDSVGNEALKALVRDVFDRLTSMQLPGPRKLSNLFAEPVRHGRFRFASLRPEDNGLLRRLNLTDEIPTPEETGLLGVVNRNANPNKIDAFLQRNSTVDIRWDPASGGVTERVTVELQNDAPTGGFSKTVIGNQAGLPDGTNVTDVAVLSAFPLVGVEVDGRPSSARPLWDGRYWRHSTRVALPAGERTRVTFTTSGAVEPGDEYRVFVVGQPLVNPGTLRIQIQATSGTFVPGEGLRVLGDRATLSLPDDATDADVRFRVRR
jgi:hypothetical protein